MLDGQTISTTIHVTSFMYGAIAGAIFDLIVILIVKFCADNL